MLKCFRIKLSYNDSHKNSYNTQETIAKTIWLVPAVKWKYRSGTNPCVISNLSPCYCVVQPAAESWTWDIAAKVQVPVRHLTCRLAASTPLTNVPSKNHVAPTWRFRWSPDSLLAARCRLRWLKRCLCNRISWVGINVHSHLNVVTTPLDTIAYLVKSAQRYQLPNMVLKTVP